MFDIGGWEFLVIVVVAIVVVGPKDLPGAIKAVTSWVRKARALARDFQSGLDEIAREAELDDVEREIKSGMNLDELRENANSIRRDIEEQVDGDGDIRRSFEPPRQFFDDPNDDFDVDPAEDEDAAPRTATRSEPCPDNEDGSGEDAPERGTPRAKTGS